MFKMKSIVPKAAVALLVTAIAIPAFLGSASAVSLSFTSVRFDRMKVSTATTGTVCARPTLSVTTTSASVTFPTGYVLSGSTITVGVSNLAWPTIPSTAVAWPGIGATGAVAGQTLTISSTALTAGTIYCFNWTAASVTIQPSAVNTNTGTVQTYTGASVLSETGNYTTSSIADDQVQVTATVPQSFSFSLSGNTDALTPSLSTGSVSSSTTARTVTVNTNAANGYTVWAKDANAGLKSIAANKTLASVGSNSTLVAGASEAFNTGVTGSGSGTSPVIDTMFVGGASRGGGLTTAFQSMASSPAPASAHVLTITNNATVIGATPAANDYADTITLVGAGLF